jgi:hypothetical protein
VNPVDASLKLLTERPCCGYGANAAPACEPTALAALALAGHAHDIKAGEAADWLAAQQLSAGTVGVSVKETSPHWPTALAILAWTGCDQSSSDGPAHPYQRQITSALQWLLGAAGKQLKQYATVGHDTTLLGWPWVEGTHAWVEPTAWSLLALRAARQTEHPRAREAARMLIDRLLPDGGCNYGNTTVLGQTLRPHVQPTGLALLALAGEHDSSGKMGRAVDYLRSAISIETTTPSLSYALLGLAAHDASPSQAAKWLSAALQRTFGRGAAPLHLALGVLASLGQQCPLIALTAQQGREH